ncbi:MAG: hypothetical protein IKG92_02870 [Bacteroidales bacterium]|nr:hypothetical protein [Bacteroidales bacterium]
MKQDHTSQQDRHELSRKSLVRILKENHYTPKAFTDALGSPFFWGLMKSTQPITLPLLRALLKATVHYHQPGLNARFKKECGKKQCWEIQSYTFSYRSQTVDGREIEMSGRVTFPNNKEEGTPHQVKTISLHMHQAFFHEEWAPSKNLMFAPLKVLWDSAVIEPDLQKWGINYGIEVDGGGSGLHMARQLADCTVAALEIMRLHGVSLAPEGYTTNWGSSQNAVPTLMFAKWYDTEAPQWFKEALRLRSTFSAQGAVDLSRLMQYSYRHPEDIDTNFVLLLSYFKAFTPSQLGGYKAEEFVPQWYLDTLFEVNGRKINLLDAVSSYYPQLTDSYFQKMKSMNQIYAPDIITADGEVAIDSPKMRAWMSCLKKYNNLDDWTPAHSVYLAHSPNDEMIPYEEAYRFYLIASQQKQNPLVHMLTVPSMRLIPKGGLKPHFVVAFVGQLLMALAENPEDMRRLYKSVK